MSDQLTREQLRKMSPAAITKALKEGRADALLSGDPAAIENAEAVAQLREAQAMQPDAEKPVGSADQGARGYSGPAYDRAWLKTASPAAVARALKAGKLDGILRDA